MDLSYTFEIMPSGKYQVRLCGEFVCYSNHTNSHNIDQYLKKKGYGTRKQYLESCFKQQDSRKVEDNMIKVGFKRLTEDAILPVKAHPTDSGFDLFASENVFIAADETLVIETGIAVKLPSGYEAQVRPRSGLTVNSKLRVQVGTIDQDYTGEIGIIIDNIARNSHIGSFFIDESTHDAYANDDSYFICKGDKLAQLVIAPVPMVETYEVDELQVTERGSKGFGSSGY